MLEYGCAVCGQRFESLEDRAEPAATLPHCGEPAPRVISAVRGRVKGTEIVSRGENGEKPPGFIGTEGLADGQSMSEWKAEHRKATRDDHRKAMDIAPQVYV